MATRGTPSSSSMVKERKKNEGAQTFNEIGAVEWDRGGNKPPRHRAPKITCLMFLCPISKPSRPPASEIRCLTFLCPRCNARAIT